MLLGDGDGEKADAEADRRPGPPEAHGYFHNDEELVVEGIPVRVDL